MMDIGERLEVLTVPGPMAAGWMRDLTPVVWFNDDLLSGVTVIFLIFGTVK